MESNLVFQLAMQTLNLAEAKELVAILEKKEGTTLKPVSDKRKQIEAFKREILKTKRKKL